MLGIWLGGDIFLTLTSKIVFFLQQEESILTGVTGMSTCIRLTVTLSPFLGKQKIRRILDPTKLWPEQISQNYTMYTTNC